MRRPRHLESQIKALVAAGVLLLTGVTLAVSLYQGFSLRQDDGRRLLHAVRSVLGTLNRYQAEPVVAMLRPLWEILPGGASQGTRGAVVLRSQDGAIWTAVPNDGALWEELLEGNRPLLVAALVTLLFVLEISVFWAYAMMRPLRRLAWACRDVGSGRWPDLETGTSSGTYEIATLHEAFRHMVNRLQQWQKVERQMGRMERLAALGQVVAGVAHEIRNPLAALRIHLDLLEEEVPPAGQSSLRVLGDEVDRLNQIVSQLLAFSRPRPPLGGPVPLGDVVAWCHQMVRERMSRQGVSWWETRPEGACKVAGDATQLRQMLLNLVLNALEAMPHGGALHIGIREGWYGAPPGEGERRQGFFLTVEDSGEGIVPAFLSRIFDPFFTTRPEGTGLGLALVHRIVELHGGTVDVVSAPGRTLFTVVLPGEEETPHDADVDCGG